GARCHGQAERGAAALPAARRRRRGAAGPPRRPAVGQAGRRRLGEAPGGEGGGGDPPRAVAVGEFGGEPGPPPPQGELVALGEVRQRGGKLVTAWAAAGDLDPAAITSNTFTLEWPPRSGRRRQFPEVDRAGWFDPATAREKLLAAQAELVDRLLAALGEG